MNDMKGYILQQIKALTAIPSPTGMTGAAESYVFDALTEMGFAPVRTRKGTVICALGGEGTGIILSAHLDTLGAVVRSVKPNGRLRFSPLGGYSFNSVENENVIIHTREGRNFTGTVQSVYASRHVWGSEDTPDKRDDKTLEIVPDERTWSESETRALGISAGDIVSFDPRTVVTESGFIKSRHLDDKAAAAILLALARACADGSLLLRRKTYLVFTVYEEIGHGASELYQYDAGDFLAIDMGCVGDDLGCREDKVSICAKDAAGPYDFGFTNEIIAHAKALGLPYAVDVYPRYSSDTATALKAGLNARFALIGPGVFASHAYERTHIDGVMAAYRLAESVIR